MLHGEQLSRLCIRWGFVMLVIVLDARTDTERRSLEGRGIVSRHRRFAQVFISPPGRYSGCSRARVTADQSRFKKLRKATGKIELIRLIV